MTTSAVATAYYGSDTQQFVNIYLPSAGVFVGATNLPVCIVVPASGFSSSGRPPNGSSGGLAQGLNTNAQSLANFGAVVCVVNYRGDASDGSIRAFPMEIDDLISACLFMLAVAPSYTTAQGMHMIGGSAGGTLAGLAVPRLLSLGVKVPSCQLLSSNTDWWSALAYYIDVHDNLANHPEWLLGTAGAQTHVGNIANAHGTFSSYGTGASANKSLQWHIDYNGAGYTIPRASTIANPANPSGTELWDEAFFQKYSVSGQASKKASSCWWHIFNSANEEIPLQQPFTLSERLSNVGTMAAVTIIPGAQHSYNYWNTVQAAIVQFALSATH
jgi:acetyl esterase/lipase